VKLFDRCIVLVLISNQADQVVKTAGGALDSAEARTVRPYRVVETSTEASASLKTLVVCSGSLRVS
jgi:hypothetical protein